MASSSTVELPLATALLRYTPNHPFVHHVLVGPILTRLAWMEGALLSNASILRRLGLSNAWIDLVALGTFSTVLATKLRGQWRTVLSVLGLGEALIRSVRLLQLQDAAEDEEEDKEKSHRRHQETMHVLCFWLLYSIIAVAQSVRATSATTPFLVASKPMSQRLATLNRRLKSLALPLTTRYPSLAFLTAARPRPRSRQPFPQPRPLIPVALPRPPVPVKYLSTELKYRLFKVVLLWTALRRDGWGASALWDWVIGPVLRVRRNRREEQGLSKRRRRLRLVLEEEEEGEGDDGGSQSPRQDVFADSETSSSTTTSPTYSRKQAHYDPNASFSSSDSPFLQSTSSAFPTPNVPFRLTSSSHPIISRGPQNDHSGYLASRIESPTPNRTAPYNEDLLGSAEKDRLGDSWGATASGDWGRRE